MRRWLQSSRRANQAPGALALGNPLLYAQQYGLLLWLRADIGIQYGATLRATGTAPPAWTISGTATRLVGLHLEIDSVAGGTGLGQATYKWSENNGTSYVATGVVTAAGPTALGTTGLSVSMAAGPYNIDNKWDATVAQWNDQSGLGNHAVQASAANQPAFNLVDANFLSHPTLEFNGSVFMQKAWSAKAQPISYVLCLRPTSVGSKCPVDSISASMAAQYIASTTIQTFCSSAFNATVAATLNSTMNLAAVFNGASSSLLRSGSETIGDVGANSSDGINIGQFHSGANRFIGQMAEVMAFNGALPLTVRTALAARLTTLYGST